jgi:hypothetical protein
LLLLLLLLVMVMVMVLQSSYLLHERGRVCCRAERHRIQFMAKLSTVIPSVISSAAGAAFVCSNTAQPATEHNSFFTYAHMQCIFYCCCRYCLALLLLLLTLLLLLLLQVRQSFATSQRNLHTQHIDSLVLHSPLPSHNQSMEGESGDATDTVFCISTLHGVWCYTHRLVK